WRSRPPPTAHAWPSAAATPNKVLKFGPMFGVGMESHAEPLKCAARLSVASGFASGVSGMKLPTAQTSFEFDAATAPRLLSFVPRTGAGTTCHPDCVDVLVVSETGSSGVGVGVGRSGTGSGGKAAGAVPGTANSRTSPGGV